MKSKRKVKQAKRRAEKRGRLEPEEPQRSPKEKLLERIEQGRKQRH
jgi:hypothetical protein